MKKQNNQELSNEQPQIEDLTVNEDRATEVKGGDDDVAYCRHPFWLTGGQKEHI